LRCIVNCAFVHKQITDTNSHLPADTHPNNISDKRGYKHIVQLHIFVFQNVLKTRDGILLPLFKQVDGSEIGHLQQERCLFANICRRSVGLTCIPSNSYQGLKWLDREDAHSNSSSAEFKECVEFSRFHATAFKNNTKNLVIIIIKFSTCPPNETTVNSTVARTKKQ